MTRLCVVTGAASGIGSAVCETLRELGYEVLGIDRKEADGIAGIDLADATVGEQVLERLQGREVDVLVNCAAVFHSGDLEHTGPEVWDRLYAVNLRAPYLLARALMPSLRARKGVIVNISSVNAIRNAKSNIAYDSLKAALDHMTRGLALELRSSGVRVNAIAPGGTHTQGLKDWIAQAKHLADPLDDQAIERHVTDRVFADPRSISDIVRFLISPEAHWINGAVIVADNAIHLGG